MDHAKTVITLNYAIILAVLLVTLPGEMDVVQRNALPVQPFCTLCAGREHGINEKKIEKREVFLMILLDF